MIKRQQRLDRIVNVEREYEAAKTAAAWLRKELDKNPSFGERDKWTAKDGIGFCENLEVTYIVRIFSEFEAGLEDYWESYLGGDPTINVKTVSLINHKIPNQRFGKDVIDAADKVRKYRNHLIHQAGDPTPPGMTIFTVNQAKSALAAYFWRLDARWK